MPLEHTEKQKQKWQVVSCRSFQRLLETTYSCVRASWQQSGSVISRCCVKTTWGNIWTQKDLWACEGHNLCVWASVVTSYESDDLLVEHRTSIDSEIKYRIRKTHLLSSSLEVILSRTILSDLTSLIHSMHGEGKMRSSFELSVFPYSL